MSPLRKLLTGMVFAVAGFSATSNAWAACTDPAGVEGEMTYNTTYDTMMFCNGSDDWVSMSGGGSGGGSSAWGDLTGVPAGFADGTDDTGGGGVSDGDKTDITVSGSGATWAIDANAVTSAKIADGTVSNDDLAGSIALSKIAITGTPNGTKFLRDDGTWQAAAGGVTDGDKTDITVSASGATWDIDAGAVGSTEIADGSVANGDLAGSIALSKIAITGTPNGTKFLRDDGTWQAAGGGAPSGVAGAIQFSNGTAFTSDAPNFFWDDAGNNLGVGTNGPGAKLDVWNNANSAAYQIVSGFRVTNNAGGTNYSRVFIGQDTTNKMFIEAADQANTKGKLSLQPWGGNVGVGTSDPSVPFEVITAAANDSVAEGRFGSSTSDYVGIHNNLTAGAYNGIVQASDKGIIFTDGAQNTGAFVIAPWASTARGLRVADTGDVTVTGNINYSGYLTDTSDMRLKTDIEPLEKYGSMSEKIAAIETYSFRMKSDAATAAKEFGVMAQDLEKIFPELVKTADDEMGSKSVNYIGLIAPMIEAIKTQQKEIDLLKEEIKTLKAGKEQ